MVWFLAIVGLIFCIWLMVVSPVFRGVMFIVIGLATAGIYYFIHQSQLENEQYRQREAASLNLIQPSQLIFNNLRLGQSAGNWQVAGTVQNNSQYPLDEFWIRVTVRDCPSEPSCVTIGENDVAVNVRVPPSQLRAFDEYVYLANMPTAQHMEWSYQISSVKADMP